MKAVVICIFFHLSIATAISQVNPSCLTAEIKQSDLEICIGESVRIESTGDSLWWFGVPGHDSIYAKEIVFTPNYSLTIHSRNNSTYVGNGILNGDFSLGDTSFYSDMNKTDGCDHKSRRVCTWNNFCRPYGNMTVDFTTGLSGLDSQFINFYFNKPIDQETNVLWSQPVAVEPFGNYTLSFWFRNLAKGVGSVQVNINGQEIHRNYVTAYNHPANDEWYNFMAGWNAMDTAIALVEIRLINDGCIIDFNYPCGSLFGLDGLELSGDYFCRDEIRLTVSQPPQKPLIQFINDTLFVSPDSMVDRYEWFYNDSLLTPFVGEYCRPFKNGNYSVKAISGSCESNSDPYTFINLSSKETILKEPIRIYPQPANSTIWIKVSEEWHSSSTIVLYDMSGRLLSHLSVNQSQDISSLNPGLYIVEIKNANHVSYYKILVE